MSRSLSIITAEAQCGKSLITLGLLELLSVRVGKLGYFRPVINHADDAQIALAKQRYALPFAPEDMYGVLREEVSSAAARGDEESILKTILAKYKALEARCEFVLCEASGYAHVTSPHEFEFNADVAANIGSPVVLLTHACGRTPHEVLEALSLARSTLLQRGATLAALMVNRAAPDQRQAILQAVGASGQCHEPCYVIPEEPLLFQPTVQEVATAIGAQHLYGSPESIQREIQTKLVAAMGVANYLTRLSEGCLVVTPGDRSDVILGSVLTASAKGFPHLAGLVLTGGIALAPSVQALIEGLPQVPFPILSVPTDTYTTALHITKIHGRISADSARKIAAALGLFEQHVDGPALVERITEATPKRMTPILFEYELIQRAKSQKMRIVLPEGAEPRILQAAEILVRRGVVDLTLLGNEAKVLREMATLGLKLDVPIIDPQTTPLREDFARTYHELRKHKGTTLEQALDVMTDVSYFGTMMVHKNLVDGMVSGAVHTTQHTIRPAFEFIRTKPGCSIVSSVFLMCLADRVLVYGDCAVNPNPDAQQLADIAISSAETAHNFGIEPRVALLSYSTGDSGKGEDVDRVRSAAVLAKQAQPTLKLEGPLQYDAAVDLEVARTKMPNSEVAGQATVFIFPDLNTGNNTYKAVQRSAGAVAIGPVLQGLNKPVNDLSRGCTVTDIVNTVAITAIQAQMAKAALNNPTS